MSQQELKAEHSLKLQSSQLQNSFCLMTIKSLKRKSDFRTHLIKNLNSPECHQFKSQNILQSLLESPSLLQYQWDQDPVLASCLRTCGPLCFCSLVYSIFSCEDPLPLSLKQAVSCQFLKTQHNHILPWGTISILYSQAIPATGDNMLNIPCLQR